MSREGSHWNEFLACVRQRANNSVQATAIFAFLLALGQVPASSDDNRSASTISIDIRQIGK